MSPLYSTLKTFGKVRTNEPLSKHTTFKIGGTADFFVTVTRIDVLVDLLKLLDGEGVRYLILGGGSNMLVRDERFEGVVVEVKSKQTTLNGNTLMAEAGCPTVEVAQISVQHHLTGFEWGVGVPGTIGGAVRGNAGAMGGTMQDSVEKVEAYVDGEVVTFTNEACRFDYRHSIFKENGGVVLRVWLALKPSERKDGMKKALEHLKYRNTTQPQGYASTGCIFKNPDWEENKAALLKHFNQTDEAIQKFSLVGKISAGWLVQEAGLKGLKIGNAEVSAKHGNFVVNLGQASAGDVLALIERIKDKVYTTFGIELEEEIQIVN